MEKDLNIIKKKYGENFARLCRALFPTLLEKEGYLPKLLLDKFAPNHSLYDDIIENDQLSSFKDMIYSFVPQSEISNNEDIKTPEELMDLAGYKLYKCDKFKDMDPFLKYYCKDEVICSYNDKHRTETNIVFFAVKKNVDEIRRENFPYPSREDEYGTSVISLQFTKGLNNTLSIKNRYNHTVSNPDATFSNNLENIIPGLTKSFEHYYDLNITRTLQPLFDLPNYVLADDGKYYKYNYYLQYRHYCPNNIIIKYGTPEQLDKNIYEVVDYFIINKQEKTISCPKFHFMFKDSLIHCIDNIQKIDIIKNSEGNRELIIKNTLDEQTILTLDDDNRIIKFTNNDIKNIDDNFMVDNLYLKEFNAEKLETIENHFLYQNNQLSKFNAPNLVGIGDFFLCNNAKIIKFNQPNLKAIGNRFLYGNRILSEFNCPNLTEIGSYFLNQNISLTSLNLQNLETVGDAFFYNVNNLQYFNAPNLKKAGNFFLTNSKKLKQINIPNIKEVGNYALEDAINLTELNTPNLTYVGYNFLAKNKQLSKFDASNLVMVNANFLCNNTSLENFDAPYLQVVGNNFLKQNQVINNFNAPLLKYVDDNFLYNNQHLEQLDLPNLNNVGESFMHYNRNLKSINIPNLKQAKKYFLYKNTGLNKISCLNLQTIEEGFLHDNQNISPSVAKNLVSMGKNCFGQENQPWTKNKQSKNNSQTQQTTNLKMDL